MKQFLQQNNLVEISSNEGFILDIRYATANNVCGEKLYDFAMCFLHQEAYEKLKKAQQIAGEMGYKIKIFDTFRPIAVQQKMFDYFSEPKFAGFISNPQPGSIPHCRGVAVDISLCHENGEDLDMNSYFDDFSSNASHFCQNISLQAKQNRLILLGIMTLAGFDFYRQEWWHYQLFNARSYQVIENFF
jgi:D-alanyl-D-alanine dipeptidase